jgi:hypothetical protein
MAVPLAHGRYFHVPIYIGLFFLLVIVPVAAQQVPQKQRGSGSGIVAARPNDSTVRSDAPQPSPAVSEGAGAGEVISTPDTAGTSDWPRLTQAEYVDAGSPRFTMNGDLPYRETHISPTTLGTFGGALVALATTITLYQQGWYADSTVGPFNFKVDWGYSRQFDKLGHTFAGWMSSYCSYEAFIASGLSKDDAALWGSIGGLFFQTFIEVQDGFHRTYGFDWTDEAANTLGAGYFYAQRKFPELQNFNLKWSVGTSGRDSARNAAQMHSRLIVDDYDRQNVWLSVKVHNLLPEPAQQYWPRWLQLAVGVGVKDVELTGYDAYRTLYVSLDYDLVALMPDLGPFGNWLVQGINNFHLPAPALQIYPDVKFALLFPIGL